MVVKLIILKNQSLFLLSLVLTTLIVSCSDRQLYKDYRNLIQSTLTNQKEIKQIITDYQSSRDSTEKVAYEFILDNLSDQYSSIYFLVKDEDTVKIEGKFSIDSILELEKQGYYLNENRLYDIDFLKAEWVHDHIRNFLTSYRNYYHLSDLSVTEYIQYCLPYRTNNEPIEWCFNGLAHRYDTSKLIRLGIPDTIKQLEDLIFKITDNYASNLHNVNQINKLSPYDILNGSDKFFDYEDFHLTRIGMFRRVGIPRVAILQSHRRNLGIKPFGTRNVIKRKDLDSLQIKSTSKVYISSFLKEDWSNPFEELLALGISRQDIPINLFIPKMKDITSKVTHVVSPSIPVVDSLSEKKIVYLCNYFNHDWLPVLYGIVDTENKVARFKDISTDVMYHLSTFKNGNLYLTGQPFSIDSIGKITCYPEREPIDQPIQITESRQGNRLDSLVSYRIFKWGGEKWTPVINQSKDNKSNSIQYKSDKTQLYTIRNEAEPKQAYRIFTLDQNNKQIWW